MLLAFAPCRALVFGKFSNSILGAERRIWRRALRSSYWYIAHSGQRYCQQTASSPHENGTFLERAAVSSAALAGL
jgi:hypothetical protein